MSSDLIKTIGFKENKKCSRMCTRMAWYQIGKYYLCNEHFEAFLKVLDQQNER